MINKTFKVYNTQTLKAAKANGYQVLKHLASLGSDKSVLLSVKRKLTKGDHDYINKLSINVI